MRLWEDLNLKSLCWCLWTTLASKLPTFYEYFYQVITILETVQTLNFPSQTEKLDTLQTFLPLPLPTQKLDPWQTLSRFSPQYSDFVLFRHSYLSLPNTQALYSSHIPLPPQHTNYTVRSLLPLPPQHTNSIQFSHSPFPSQHTNSINRRCSYLFLPSTQTLYNPDTFTFPSHNTEILYSPQTYLSSPKQKFYTVHTLTFASSITRYDLWTISMYTPLGGHNCVQGKKITIQILDRKPQILETLTPRSTLEAPLR